MNEEREFSIDTTVSLLVYCEIYSFTNWNKCLLNDNPTSVHYFRPVSSVIRSQLSSISINYCVYVDRWNARDLQFYDGERFKFSFVMSIYDCYAEIDFSKLLLIFHEFYERINLANILRKDC